MELVLYLTNNCNMKCQYCYQGHDKKDVFLSFDKAKKAIDELSSGKEKISIGFFGGEPLLNKDLLYKVVDYCEKKFKKEKVKHVYSVTTNGTLIDEEFAKFCKKHNISVGISIDGKKESHNKNRLDASGSSTFDKTLEGVKICLNNKVDVMALPVICLNNVEDMADNFEFFIEQGIKSITFNFNYSDNWDDASLDILRKQYNLINGIYIRELRNGNKVKVYPIDSKVGFMLSKNSSCAEKCNLDRTCVECDGNYYPCIQFVGKEKFKIGSVEEGINNNKRIELIKIRNKSEVACTNCALKRFCGYNCGCIRLNTTDDIVNVSPLVCETEKIYINTANELIKEVGKESDVVKFLWIKS